MIKIKGKRLSIEDLERLPIGTMVSVKRGYFNVDYKTDTHLGKLCLSNFKLNTLYYEDILKLEVYEYTREIATAPEIGYLSNLEIDCFDQIKFCNGNSIQSLKNHKPEIRIEREFNIAKKKELDVKPLNGNEKYKLNKARLEFLVDLALEENNKEDFIKFSNKLKKYYRQEVEL